MLEDEAAALGVVLVRVEEESEANVLVLEAGGLGDHLVAVPLDLPAPVVDEVRSFVDRGVNGIESAVVVLAVVGAHHHDVHVGVHRRFEADRMADLVQVLVGEHVKCEGHPLECKRVPLAEVVLLRWEVAVDEAGVVAHGPRRRRRRRDVPPRRRWVRGRWVVRV